MFTKEIFSLVFVEDCHCSEVFYRFENLRIVYSDWIRLINHKIIGFPLFCNFIIRLVEEGKNIFLFRQKPIQNLFCNIHLIDHHVIVVWILCGNYNAELVTDSNLR